MKEEGCKISEFELNRLKIILTILLIYEPDSIHVNSSYFHLTQLPVRIPKWSKGVTVGRGLFFSLFSSFLSFPLEPCREYKTRDVAAAGLVD